MKFKCRMCVLLIALGAGAQAWGQWTSGGYVPFNAFSQFSGQNQQNKQQEPQIRYLSPAEQNRLYEQQVKDAEQRMKNLQEFNARIQKMQFFGSFSLGTDGTKITSIHWPGGNFQSKDEAEQTAMAACQKNSRNCRVVGTFSNSCAMPYGSKSGNGSDWRVMVDSDKKKIFEKIKEACTKQYGEDCGIYRNNDYYNAWCTGL